MGIFDFWRKSDEPEATATAPEPKAMAGESGTFWNLDDPDLIEFMRHGGGSVTESGAYVTAEKALSNMAVLRCVNLISATMGMLPIKIIKNGDEKQVVNDHHVARLLHKKPNNFQTPYIFKSTLQMRALVHGDGYARIVRGLGDKPVALIPLESQRMEAVLTDMWELEYHYTKKDGSKAIMKRSDVFHLKGPSLDGIKGLSLVKLAKEAIGLALQAEKAAARLFRNGMMVGGALTHPMTLSEEAHQRLQNGMDQRYSGAANAHRWLILEEGMTANQLAQTAADSQHLENRAHQIEEVARCFGVPRPLLMMDDTSWGSGIEQLGIYFVQYALQQWFTAWENEISATLLSEQEAEVYSPKVNERALMRGTLKEQAEFFAKALGSGGHPAWMKVDEVRDLSDLPKDKSNPESSKLQSAKPAAAPGQPKETSDEPEQKPAKPQR